MWQYIFFFIYYYTCCALAVLCAFFASNGKHDGRYSADEGYPALAFSPMFSPVPLLAGGDDIISQNKH